MAIAIAGGGPSSRSDIRSAAYETESVEPFFSASGRLTFHVDVSHPKTSSSPKRIGRSICVGNRAAAAAAPAAMTATTYARAAGGRLANRRSHRAGCSCVMLSIPDHRIAVVTAARAPNNRLAVTRAPHDCLVRASAPHHGLRIAGGPRLAGAIGSAALLRPDDVVGIVTPRDAVARGVGAGRAPRGRWRSAVPVAARSGAFNAPHNGCAAGDRKSTRLNSSHEWISYAVFCLKKKNDNGDAVTPSQQ